VEFSSSRALKKFGIQTVAGVAAETAIRTRKPLLITIRASVIFSDSTATAVFERYKLNLRTSLSRHCATSRYVASLE